MKKLNLEFTIAIILLFGFCSAIISGLQSVPVDIWTSVSDLPPHLKSLIFCLGVVNGLLVTRQLLGSRGLVQCYPLEGGKYLRLAIEALIDLSGSLQDSTDNQIKFFAKKIVQVMFALVGFIIWDRNRLISSMIFFASKSIKRIKIILG